MIRKIFIANKEISPKQISNPNPCFGGTMTIACSSYEAFSTQSARPVNCIQLWQQESSPGQFHIYGPECQELSKLTAIFPASVQGTLIQKVQDYSCIILNQSQLDPLLKECLSQLEKRIEIWTCNQGNWVISRQGSPTNPMDFTSLLTETTPIDSSDNSCGCLSIWLEQSTPDSLTISMVTCKLESARQFLWTNYQCTTPKEISLFLNIIITQLAIKEIICGKELIKNTNIVDLIEQFCLGNSISLSFVDSKSPGTSTTDNLSFISKFLSISQSIGELVESGRMINLLGPLVNLIRWLELDKYDCYSNSFSIKSYNPNSWMILDGNSLKSLHLFPVAGAFGKYSSLFGLLNRCNTNQGTRLLAGWIRQPLVKVDEIQERLNCVEFFINDIELRKDLHDDKMRGLPDLARIITKLLNDKISLESVLKLYDSCCRMNDILTVFNNSKYESSIIKQNFVSQFDQLSSRLDKFCKLIEKTVDFEALQNHEYSIKADFLPELVEIKQKKDELLSTINSEFIHSASLLNLEPGKKVKLESNSIYKHFMRVSRTDAHLVRNLPDKFVELATQKNGIYFSTQLMRTCSLDYDSLNDKYREKQGEIVKEIVQVTRTYANELITLNSLYAKLDVLLAFAEVAVTAPIPYCKPTVLEHSSDDATINLVGARHACLEMQETNFIPNGITMNHSTREMLIITGPNMGGKSTLIRQVAIISILAQLGSFVPCTSATLPIFDRVLTRVGANDLLSRNISTFMLEMLESNQILQYSTNKSLVIIDELGRGTSTHDGFGLAWSIANELVQRVGCFTLFATHFHEMTKLKERISKVANVHVNAKSSSTDSAVVFDYQLKEGPCEKSFGINVASICKFPSIVLEIARLKADQLEVTTN